MLNSKHLQRIYTLPTLYSIYNAINTTKIEIDTIQNCNHKTAKQQKRLLFLQEVYNVLLERLDYLINECSWDDHNRNQL